MTIRLNQLSFSYQNENILENINYTFEKGHFYGIIGPNGSGKTTLLKLISNLVNTPKDSVFLKQQDIRSYRDKKRAELLSYVPQIIGMEYAFSVYDVVAMGRYPYLKGFNDLAKVDLQIIDEALKNTDLLAYKDRKVNSLSGGELQRVILARTIAQETQFILLDEPISHLDIHHQLDILNLSKNLCVNQKRTVICVLHDLNLTLKFCDRAILLKDGEIFKQGLVSQVITPENIQAVYGISIEIISVKNQPIIVYS